MNNSFGHLLRLTSWGESHGQAIGGVLDGMPSGVAIDRELILLELGRRAPGKSDLSSPRKEPDEVELLSGLYEGKTTGAPISFLIRNLNQRSQDYTELSEVFRPAHADYTYHHKYQTVDPRGGGRASARETAVRVVAGAIVRQWLTTLGIDIVAYASRIGQYALEDTELSWEALLSSRSLPLGLPEGRNSKAMQELIQAVRKEGDSIGGIVTCLVRGLPIGLGEPIYMKLEAQLASAMLSINATRGFELGEGFALAQMRGSEANDPLRLSEDGRAVIFGSNYAGGTLGGISSGQDLRMHIAFKPTPTIALPQETLSKSLKPIELKAQGRHDPCVVPRAIPVVEAMCALTLGDLLCMARSRAF